jgi:hypothetical protein
MKTDTATGYCLLHGDYHPMELDCWETTLDFWFRCQEMSPDMNDKEKKDRYDAEVERKMLYDLAIEIASGMWNR